MSHQIRRTSLNRFCERPFVLPRLRRKLFYSTLLPPQKKGFFELSPLAENKKQASIAINLTLLENLHKATNRIPFTNTTNSLPTRYYIRYNDDEISTP
jgi:hypothetical protein